MSVEDAYNNVVTTDTSTVSLSLNNGTFSGGSSTATSVVSSGVASFGALKIDQAGNYSLSATDAVLAAAGPSSSFAISPAAAYKVAFVKQPANTSAGVAISPAVTAQVEDQFNNVVVTDSSTVTLALSSGTFEGGSVNATAQATSGLATFSGLKIDTAGTYTLSATDGSLISSGASTSFTVSAGVASQVVFGQHPSDAIAGAAMSPLVTVLVEDSYNNVVKTDGSTVTITLSSGTFAGGSTTASAMATDGVATFSGLTIDLAGNYTLAVNDGSLSPAASSSSFTINPAAANHFEVTSSFSSSDMAGTQARSPSPRWTSTATQSVAVRTNIGALLTSTARTARRQVCPPATSSARLTRALTPSRVWSSRRPDWRRSPQPIRLTLRSRAARRST